MERDCRLVWAASLPLPTPGLGDGPKPCKHTWGEPEAVRTPGGGSDETTVCSTCGGFVSRCRRCSRYHLVDEGRGGEYMMLPWVTESWLTEHGCAAENFGDVPIPFVRMPPDYEPSAFELAIYEETDGEPGHYELQWFSERTEHPVH